MSSSPSDIAFSHGSEAIREAIIKNKLKAPDCSVAWQTTEKAKLLNQLRLYKFDSLLSGDYKYPTRDLQIFLFMKALLNNPNLSKLEAEKMIADGSFKPPELTITENNKLIEQQEVFDHKSKSLCSFLFSYCEGTKLQHLIIKYQNSNDYMQFYKDIIDSYENTGKNAESKKLFDQINNLTPSETDNALTDFAAISTSLNNLLLAMENLPKNFELFIQINQK